jgi:hypothetical protein
LKVVECATHRKDVERGINKVKKLPNDIERILVTPKKTIEEMSFDIEKINIKEYFDEIWTPQIEFNLTCSQRSANYPGTLQMHFSFRSFTKEVGLRKK